MFLSAMVIRHEMHAIDRLNRRARQLLIGADGDRHQSARPQSGFALAEQLGECGDLGFAVRKLPIEIDAVELVGVAVFCQRGDKPPPLRLIHRHGSQSLGAAPPTDGDLDPSSVRLRIVRNRASVSGSMSP